MFFFCMMWATHFNLIATPGAKVADHPLPYVREEGGIGGEKMVSYDLQLSKNNSIWDNPNSMTLPTAS